MVEETVTEKQVVEIKPKKVPDEILELHRQAEAQREALKFLAEKQLRPLERHRQTLVDMLIAVKRAKSADKIHLTQGPLIIEYNLSAHREANGGFRGNPKKASDSRQEIIENIEYDLKMTETSFNAVRAQYKLGEENLEEIVSKGNEAVKKHYGEAQGSGQGQAAN